MIEALSFDLGGLMVDSEPHALATWQAVMARRGIRLDQPAADFIVPSLFAVRDALDTMLIQPAD